MLVLYIGKAPPRCKITNIPLLNWCSQAEMGLCRRFDKGCLYRWRIGSLPCLVFSVSHFSWALPPEGEGAMFLLTIHARELPVLNSPCHMWFIIILLFLHPSLLYVLQPKHNLAFLRKMRTLSILVTLSALSRSFHFFCERCSVPCGARSAGLLPAELIGTKSGPLPLLNTPHSLLHDLPSVSQRLDLYLWGSSLS